MTAKREIAVVTTARSDFGLYEPLLLRMREDAAIELRLMVSGAHFAEEFGMTVREIETGGFTFERGLEMRLDSGSPESIAKSVGVGVLSFSQAFSVRRPDLLVVLGDRIEMLAAAVASLPFNIPIAHLYGGKISEGAIDELVRHALTKMSHLHFVTTERSAQRVRQMGEESWRIHNFGSPGLDRIHLHPRASPAEACRQVGLDSRRPFLLVTFHPVTLEAADRENQVTSLLAALERYDGQILMTYPNADAGYTDIVQAFEEFARARPSAVKLIRNAGARLYFDLMACASAMVGNSSSGIAEAPSCELPAVNVGTRQAGFAQAANVISVGYEAEEIEMGIRRATSAEFRRSLKGLQNPYGDGRASERIAGVLRAIPLDDRLLRKKFVDAAPAA